MPGQTYKVTEWHVVNQHLCLKYATSNSRRRVKAKLSTAVKAVCQGKCTCLDECVSLYPLTKKASYICVDTPIYCVCIFVLRVAGGGYSHFINDMQVCWFWSSRLILVVCPSVPQNRTRKCRKNRAKQKTGKHTVFNNMLRRSHENGDVHLMSPGFWLSGLPSKAFALTVFVEGCKGCLLTILIFSLLLLEKYYLVNAVLRAMPLFRAATESDLCDISHLCDMWIDLYDLSYVWKYVYILECCAPSTSTRDEKLYVWSVYHNDL